MAPDISLPSGPTFFHLFYERGTPVIAEATSSFLTTKHRAQFDNNIEASEQQFSLPQINKFTIVHRRLAFSSSEVREDCQRRRFVRSLILHSVVPSSSYPPPERSPHHRGTSLIRNRYSGNWWSFLFKQELCKKRVGFSYQIKQKSSQKHLFLITAVSHERCTPSSPKRALPGRRVSRRTPQEASSRQKAEAIRSYERGTPVDFISRKARHIHALSQHRSCSRAAFPDVPRRAYLAQGGPIYPEAGISIPRRAHPSPDGPVYPEAGRSVPRRACLPQGGFIRPEAGPCMHPHGGLQGLLEIKDTHRPWGSPMLLGIGLL